jgi:hydrolase, TatD family
MKLFDTHAHLTDGRFDEDREALIESFAAQDIDLVLDCAAEQMDWEKVEKISQYEDIYAAYGIHPHSAADASADYLEQMQVYLRQEKAVAVGEIGLDYHYDFSPRDVQKKVFREQIELAIAMDKPIVVHDREAHSDTLSILQEYRGKVQGVLHCYSGSAEMMPQFLDLGFYLGFGGSSTFQNAKKTRAAAMAIPLDRMVLETDSPYLAPVPFRGQRNDPTRVKTICNHIAAIRNMESEELAQITHRNGKELFDIKRQG